MANSKHRENVSVRSSGTNRSNSRAEADITSNKIIASFVIALLGTFGIMLLRNRVAAQGPATMTGLKILAVLGAVIFIASMILWYSKRKSSKTGAYLYVFIALAGALACICSLLMLAAGYKICAFLAFILPIMALYYFLSTVFHGENFLCLVLSGLGALLFWFSYRYSDTMASACVTLHIVFFLLLAAVCVLVLVRGKKGIQLKAGDRLRTVLAGGERHAVLYITLAFLAAAVIISYIIGVPAAYVLMFVAIAYTLVCAVVFTARL